MRRGIATSRPIPRIGTLTIVVFLRTEFCDDEELTDEGQDCDPPAGPA